MSIEKIVAYLAQGIAEGDIAAAVGCTPAYISQVKTKAEYPRLLEDALLRLKISEEDKVREVKYSDLETKVIGKLDEQVAFAEFPQLVNLMDKLIRRKQMEATKGIVINDNRIQNNVTLTMPTAAIPDIRFNSQREIIGIGEQSLAPATSTAVRGIFAILERKRKEEAKNSGRIFDAEPPADF